MVVSLGLCRSHGNPLWGVFKFGMQIFSATSSPATLVYSVMRCFWYSARRLHSPQWLSIVNLATGGGYAQANIIAARLPANFIGSISDPKPLVHSFGVEWSHWSTNRVTDRTFFRASGDLLGMYVENPRLEAWEGHSNSRLELFVCFAFFAYSAVFSLIDKLSNTSPLCIYIPIFASFGIFASLICILCKPVLPHSPKRLSLPLVTNHSAPSALRLFDL